MSWSEKPVVTPGTGALTMIGVTGQPNVVIGVTNMPNTVIGVTGSAGEAGWDELPVVSTGTWEEVNYG